MSKTMKSIIEETKTEAVHKLMKKYERTWFYGNDEYYYYLIKSLPDNQGFLVSDGNKILALLVLHDNAIKSFAPMPEHEFKDELDIILAKAFLTGVYITHKKLYHKNERTNIMNNYWWNL